MQPATPVESTSVNSTVAPYAIGALTTLQITKLMPFGIAGRLPDGSRGIVREREIAWSDVDRVQWQERIVPGAHCQVRVLAERPDHWELSLRMAEYDPWSQFNGVNLVGRLVRGTVTGFGTHTAFVELNTGLRAILEEDELPEWVEAPIHEALWVGDLIYAMVKKVDLARREVQLSMLHLLQKRWPPKGDAHLLPATVTDPHELENEGVEERNPITPSLPTTHRPLSVLVIEDDECQNRAIVQGLNQAGHHTEGIITGSTALTMLMHKPFDCVVCDVNLGEEDGIAIVKEIGKLYPKIHCILMTDWMTTDSREADLMGLNQRSVPLLIKPVMPEEFLTALADPGRYLLAPRSPEQTRRQLFAAHKQLRKGQSTKREIFAAIRQLRKQSGAEKIVLFRLDLSQRAIETVTQYGRKQLDSNAISKLIYSPVRDVAEDQQFVVIEDRAEVEAYARYLIPLLSFTACLGVPVPAEITDRYALFLFHSEHNYFTKPMQREARITARIIGTLLERQLFHEQQAEVQRTLLMGHLARGLIHETNHQMSPILFTLSDLSEQCALVERSISYKAPQTGEQIAEARQLLQQLTDNMRKLVKTTRLFARIAVQDAEELLRMDQIIEQSIELVKDSAHRAHVQIHTHFPPHAMITQLKQTQVQQVIVNLLLNSIQQIERTRSHGGQIKVTLELAHSLDSIDVMLVTIEDDGPGIHHRQWETIFELGMTTRPNVGSGMGLYISRRLMEDCGGRLYVGGSFMHWGTKMVAEFPIYLSMEQGVK